MKEEILKKNRPGYYDSNYVDMYGEIDARIAGMQKEWEYIQRVDAIDPRDESIIKKDEEIYNKIINEEIKRIERGGVKNDGLPRYDLLPEKYLDQRLEVILKANPEILVEYPELLIEFNNDGRKKRISIILEEYENLSKNNQIMQKDIYEHIFETENYLNDEELAQDIKQLIRYKPKSDKGEELKKSIIINLVLPNIVRIETERFKENIIEGEYLKYNKIYEETIEIIKEFIKNNPEDEISEILTKIVPAEQSVDKENDEVRSIKSNL